ncbi:hypothetical protein [Streptomyces sp. TLI_146]|uniref:hypothetical protein n=1 Tax=Streptomyces sp. TLI_146 TaxID=1938858 RepID=UPI00117DCDAF|nr:hypothetical protein [Streptomyces sp. TLI_146]
MALFVTFSLALGACSSGSHQPKGLTATVGSKGGTISGQAGAQSVTITVPPGGADDNTEITFQDRHQVNTDATDGQLGIARLGTPVEVTTTRGRLAQGRVTLSYNPKQLPPGSTASQIGILVFDPKLGAWFPLLDSRVDSAAHRVTGTAPHFSLFKTYVIAPGKRLLHIAGRGIQMAVDATTSVLSYFQKLITVTASTIVEDLFAVPPKLKCDKPSAVVTASTHTAVGDGRFHACTDGDGKDITLNMVNGVGYPLRLDRLPQGVTVSIKDALGSGDTVSVIRNLYYMTQGQKVIAGAKQGSVTVNDKMTRTANLHGHMDGTAVAFDMMLGTLLVFMPALSADKSWLEGIVQNIAVSQTSKTGGSGLAKAAQTATHTATSTPAKSEGQPDRAAELGNVLAAGDCILDSKDALASDGSPGDRFKSAVKAAQTCGKLVLAQFNTTALIPALLDSLKLVPEIVQAQLAGISNVFTGGKYKLTSVYVDLTRFDAAAALKANFQGEWYAHRRLITIDENGAGTLNWGPYWNYRDPSSAPACTKAKHGCEMSFQLTVTPAGATARITASNSPQDWRVGQVVGVLSQPSTDTIIFDTANNIDDAGIGGTNQFCGPRSNHQCGA